VTSVDVSTTVAISRPRADVAAFAMDPTRAPDWYVNIRAVEWKTPPPVGLAVRRANRKDLAVLKALLESRWI
jgi:hypothetical protein